MKRYECDHPRTIEVLMPEGHVHYAKLICTQGCGKFLDWIPNPSTILNQEHRRKTINQMLKRPRMTQYHANFLKGVRHAYHLSERQEKFYNSLQAIYNKIPDKSKVIEQCELDLAEFKKRQMSTTSLFNSVLA